MRRLLFILGVLLLGIAINAKADTISFSNHTGPSMFAFTTGPQSIAEGLATFHGGAILTNETFAAVTGSVYGTVSNSIVPTPFTFLNPLTITFSQAVSNLSLFVVNNEADTYFLKDNNGKSISAAFGANSTGGLLSLIDTNILSATIGTTNSSWDFALSGGSYNSPTPTPTPEPGTLIMLGTGLLGLMGVARRKLLI